MDIRSENMELDLMFTGAEDILSRWRQPRREVMELVASVTDREHYGTTIEFLGVNVVFQDAGLIKVGTTLSRESKTMTVDIEVSRKWAKDATDDDIKVALLQCLVRAVENTRQRLTRRDDSFEADKLLADLQEVANRLERKTE